MRGENDR
jgi:hypothetical protein